MQVQRVPSGGSRCATGRDDRVPLKYTKVPAWIPPSAIKREALTTNIDSDDEELFRKVRGLLNKLTPEKFEKLSVEFCNLSIKNPKALKGIIVLILDKALSESAYSSLYAQLCQRLDKWVPNFEPPPPQPSTPTKSITTFRKLLLLTCQHEFDNRSSYTSKLLIDQQNEANNTSDDEKKAQLELARQNAKKKMLGNVKFIGELGRLGLLSEAILHKCIKTLLEKQRDEKYLDMSDDLECLCKMMPTVGKKLDQGEAIKLMDQYFERMRKLFAMKAGNEYAFPVRIRFMLQDLNNLREKMWQPRQNIINQEPKTMHEVRNGALIEKMAAAALAASSRDAQEQTAAHACFNLSSLNLTSNSALVMNMYQQLSQQPNMSLLNAINNKIATNKNNNIALAQAQAAAAKDINTSSVPHASESTETTEKPAIVETVPANGSEMNLVNRQVTTKQNFTKQLPLNQTDQNNGIYNSNTQKQSTNFSFQRSSTQQRSITNSSATTNTTDTQKTQKNLHNQQKHNNTFMKNQFIDSKNDHQQQQQAYVVKKSSNFNWNQPHPQAAEPPNQLKLKTQDAHSVSLSSSPFSSTSSLSVSPPPVQENPQQPQQQPKHFSSSSSSSSTSSNSYKSDSGNKPTTINTNQYNRTLNNTNNFNNTYYNKPQQQPQRPYQQQQQRGPYHPNSNHSIARNALGVSTNDVLPLNKPMIPLDKVTKYDNSKNAIRPKMPLNLFSTNIYNLASQMSQSKKNASSSILDEALMKRLIVTVDKFLNENRKSEENMLENSVSIMNSCIDDIRELKLNNEKLSDVIRLFIAHSLSKSDSDRLNISKLFVTLHKADSTVAMSTDVFINGLKATLLNLTNLESEYHCVKSNVSMYAARAVCDSIITFDDLGVLMRHGAHYPLFFLCMQNMHKLKSKEWLREQLERSRISLIEMLPSSDRYKERLIQILEDRELSFVYPMLKIESALLEKIQSSLSNDELKEWIKENVNVNVTASNDFIHSLITCIVKNAAENSVLSTENNDLNSKMDKSHVNKQKHLIQKYQQILQDYLNVPKLKRAKQVEAIYAMQVYANSKGFPKYFLAHLFNQMYDLEIIEEEAFLQWKDEINENYPNKGQALFYLQRWFNWLQEASEESSNSETEELGNKLSKAPAVIAQANGSHVEV